MIETLTLGSLQLVGERRPSAILVTVANDFGEQRFYVSKDQWQSLLALADTKLAGEREVERLRAELAALEGETAGLRVSEAFFRQRCDVLEAAAVRKLASHEQNALKGCCPLCAEAKE